MGGISALFPVAVLELVTVRVRQQSFRKMKRGDTMTRKEILHNAIICIRVQVAEINRRKCDGENCKFLIDRLRHDIDFMSTIGLIGLKERLLKEIVNRMLK